jgi:hypothetical protein
MTGRTYDQWRRSWPVLIAHADVVHGTVETLPAVAAVSGDGAGTGPADAPPGGRGQLSGVGRVARPGQVVGRNIVAVLGDLGLVTALGRLIEPAKGATLVPTRGAAASAQPTSTAAPRS